MYNFPQTPYSIIADAGNRRQSTTHATLYQQSSPMSFITAQSPPTIILHGGADIVVAPAQSVMLRDQLQASAVPNQYVFYPTESHGWTGANMIDSFDKIMAFLSTHVN
jgi:dipeptidyl aminopeptidase/acylaminoacyl peptidase